jgi:hypothetical protein
MPQAQARLQGVKSELLFTVFGLHYLLTCNIGTLVLYELLFV